MNAQTGRGTRRCLRLQTGGCFTRSTVALLFFVAALCLVPALLTRDPMQTNLSADAVLQPPGAVYPFGADNFGRDLFARFWHGGRVTLLYAVGAWSIGWGGGVLLALAAHGGSTRAGWINAVIRALVDTLLALPPLILALVILTWLGNRPAGVIVAVGLSQVAPTMAFAGDVFRRVQVQPYITASEMLGASPGWVARVHLLPNALPALLGYGLLVFSYGLLQIAGLHFLGFGLPPGTPEWGLMLYEGRQVYRAAPWVAAVPGAGISLLVLLAQWTANRLQQRASQTASAPLT